MMSTSPSLCAEYAHPGEGTGTQLSTGSQGSTHCAARLRNVFAHLERRAKRLHLWHLAVLFLPIAGTFTECTEEGT